MPLLRTPMRAEMTKTPPRVTPSMTTRKPQPVSPPIVPESSVRIRLSHAASTKPGGSPPSWASRPSETIAAATRTMARETTPSPPMRAMVPRAMRLSKR
jgi:hypothetical protein